VTKHVNSGAYKVAPSDPIVELKVRVKLDQVPGWGDRIEDHINMMFLHDLYILDAEVIHNPDGSSSVQL
jgi:hypothetical protein